MPGLGSNASLKFAILTLIISKADAASLSLTKSSVHTYIQTQREMRRVDRMATLYRALLKNDWTRLIDYYKDNREALSSPLTVNQDTIFHIAVYTRNDKMLEKLLKLAPPAACRVWNRYGNTALHEAASVGDVKMAKHLVELDEGLHQAEAAENSTKLVEIKNFKGESALFRAAAFGRTDMVMYLTGKVNDIRTHVLRFDNASMLHAAVLGKHFDTVLALLGIDKSLSTQIDENDMTCLQLLANMPSAFKSGYPMLPSMRILYWCLPNHYYGDKEHEDTTISQTEDLESGHGMSHRGHSTLLCIYRAIFRCVYTCLAVLPTVETLWIAKANHQKALKLLKILAENDSTWKGEVPGNENKGAERKTFTDHSIETGILIAAARHGITEIVKHILKVYPQGIELLNERDENIFHVAARHGKKEILDLLQIYPHVPIRRLIKKINVDGESVLHQAAYRRETRLRNRPGEALRMQSEIQWFKRVKKIVPRHFLNYKNHKNRTAQELFTLEYKKLVEEGTEWLRTTTKACTIVAVLIATVAFTCAYTVPGGNDSKGNPQFENRVSFHVFVISDAISLCFALTSVVIFLSIMTSKMHEKDFRISLPLKLVFGLTTLFFSVSALMVSFAATLILIIRQKLHWAAIPIYAVACFPVSIFLILQFPLYLNMAWFTVRDILFAIDDWLPRPIFVTGTYVALSYD